MGESLDSGLRQWGKVGPSWIREHRGRRGFQWWAGWKGPATSAAGESRLGGAGQSMSVSGWESHLVYEHCAAEPPPACLLQDGEGAVIPDDHHLHRDALSLGLLPGQAEVEPIPRVVLHDEEGPHCRSSRQGPVSACPPHSSPSCMPGLPVPAWATALMAAKMLPTAGEVNTAPAMTPVSIPFPMKPGDRGGGAGRGCWVGTCAWASWFGEPYCALGTGRAPESLSGDLHSGAISLERPSLTRQLKQSATPSPVARCSFTLLSRLHCLTSMTGMLSFTSVFPWLPFVSSKEKEASGGQAPCLSGSLPPPKCPAQGQAHSGGSLMFAEWMDGWIC